MQRRTQVLSSHVDAAISAADQGEVKTGRSPDVSSETLLQTILDTLSDMKAQEIVEVDLRGRSSIADFMLICSGRSSRQVAAISDRLVQDLKEKLGKHAKIEGKDAGDWVLIDAGDVIVHIFRPEVREFYQLEKMWLPPASAAGRA